jgi:hypothetical protein
VGVSFIHSKWGGLTHCADCLHSCDANHIQPGELMTASLNTHEISFKIAGHSDSPGCVEPG